MRITQLLYQAFKKKKEMPKETINQHRKDNYFFYGLCSLGFATCFAIIPFYRVFCEHVGLIGNTDQKDYSVKAKDVKVLKKYKIKFTGQGDLQEQRWDFQPEVKQVNVSAGETALMFYRIKNNMNKPLIGFATYNIYPEEAMTYFTKIQCFCFNNQMLTSKEELTMPLYFYLEPEILQDMVLLNTRQIRVDYRFYLAGEHNLSEALKVENDRLNAAQKKLREIRRKKGIIEDDDED